MKIFVFLALLTTSIAAQGQEIASCANPKVKPITQKAAKFRKTVAAGLKHRFQKEPSGL